MADPKSFAPAPSAPATEGEMRRSAPDPAAVTPRRATEGQSWLAIADGRVRSMVSGEDSRAALEEFISWWPDFGLTEIVLVPDAVARRFYGQPWPGRDAALAQIAQEADRG